MNEQDASNEKPSKAKIWLLEIRAPFLTAAIVPVILGTAVAWATRGVLMLDVLLSELPRGAFHLPLIETAPRPARVMLDDQPRRVRDSEPALQRAVAVVRVLAAIHQGFVEVPHRVETLPGNGHPRT